MQYLQALLKRVIIIINGDESLSSATEGYLVATVIPPVVHSRS